MSRLHKNCSDCDVSPETLSRRHFLAAGGAAALALGGVPVWAEEGKKAAATATTTAKVTAESTPESLVKVLYDTLSPKQKEEICFDWDYVESKTRPGLNGRNAPARGLLRTYVANNWQITSHSLVSNKDKFYNDEQRDIVRKIFEGLIQPEWQKKIDKQLEDDAGGFGLEQSIAIFGKPGDGKFEFVMTGRHMTLRCDGNSADHVAFGGPIFYGHAAEEFNEKADHPGNVFWPQALAANKLYQMLDGKQQKTALENRTPREQAVGFRKPSEFDGLPVSDMSSDQKEHLQGVLKMLVEPYRTSDKEECLAALAKHGGLDKCSLAFYADQDIGKDGVWDNWRLEGPAFVWYFRGNPHVHVWVNVSDDPSVKANT
jgi:hypothetical protein